MYELILTDHEKKIKYRRCNSFLMIEFYPQIILYEHLFMQRVWRIK